MELRDSLISGEINEKDLKDFMNLFFDMVFTNRKILSKTMSRVNYSNNQYYDSLRSINVDKCDAKILVDSYGIFNNFNEKYLFVTNDKGILNLSVDIKTIFSNNMDIKNP